jgi:hypothetical protein
MKHLITFTMLLFAVTAAWTQNKLTGYEYWFNNDFAGKTMVEITPAAGHSLNADFDVSAFPAGVNVFNIRYKDSRGAFSSILSKVFVKTEPAPAAQNKLVAYEYWFNNDYSIRQTAGIAPGSTHHLTTGIDVSALPDGMNIINLRYMDEQGRYSSVFSTMYVKQPAPLSDNKITTARYWINGDAGHAVYLNLVPGQQVNLAENLDLSRLPEGNHEINFQFKDRFGTWSAVLTQSIQKLSFPVADFSYEVVSTCDSTLVRFINKSVDADTRHWDFGDGTSDTTANPTHVYRQPGSYLVTLTVADTLSKADSTHQVLLTVTGNTQASFSVTACDSYTTPGGKVVTQSGICYDTIPNRWGCDSLLTIDLTVHNTPGAGVTHNNTLLTAVTEGVSYQWLDCGNGSIPLPGETNRSFRATVNGSYAVRVAHNGCADTSLCTVINTVGVEAYSPEEQITAYPNPTQGQVSIDLGRSRGETEVSISNATGQPLQTLRFNNQRIVEITLPEPAGIYLIAVKHPRQRYVLKVVKE